MQILILLTVLSADTWQLQTLDLINEARADANARELALYGEILAFREPLEYDTICERSSQWWCQALKGSGHFDHFGYLNKKGYLIDESGKQISRVWLPGQSDGLTYWGYRLRHLGVERFWESGEVGGLFSRPSPATIVTGWTRSGWNDDPRQAKFHYGGIINPAWRRAGLGRQTWGKGLESVFCDFLP